MRVAVSVPMCLIKMQQTAFQFLGVFVLKIEEGEEKKKQQPLRIIFMGIFLFALSNNIIIHAHIAVYKLYILLATTRLYCKYDSIALCARVLTAEKEIFLIKSKISQG